MLYLNGICFVGHMECYLTHFSNGFQLYLRDNLLNLNNLLLIRRRNIISLPRSKVVNGFIYQAQTHKHVLFVNKDLLQAISANQIWDKFILVKSLLDFLQLLFTVNHQIIPSYIKTLYVLWPYPDCRSG